VEAGQQSSPDYVQPSSTVPETTLQLLQTNTCTKIYEVVTSQHYSSNDAGGDLAWS